MIENSERASKYLKRANIKDSIPCEKCLLCDPDDSDPTNFVSESYYETKNHTIAVFCSYNRQKELGVLSRLADTFDFINALDKPYIVYINCGCNSVKTFTTSKSTKMYRYESFDLSKGLLFIACSRCGKILEFPAKYIRVL